MIITAFHLNLTRLNTLLTGTLGWRILGSIGGVLDHVYGLEVLPERMGRVGKAFVGKGICCQQVAEFIMDGGERKPDQEADGHTPHEGHHSHQQNRQARPAGDNFQTAEALFLQSEGMLRGKKSHPESQTKEKHLHVAEEIDIDECIREVTKHDGTLHQIIFPALLPRKIRLSGITDLALKIT